MRSTIKRLMVVVISMPVMALTSQPARALSCQDLRDAGDVLRYALPVWAYAMTAGYKDGRGAFQYTKTLVFTGMGTGILKTIGDKSRPRAQTSTESFVSGHVSSAMSGAAFIYTRYGKPFGIPAYLLAGLTAYSRQCSQAHFADDTLGGTMVALMSNWYATSPRKGNTELYPSFTSNGLGFSFKTFFDGNRKPAEPTTFNPRYRLLFELGPLSQDKNLVRAYNPGGNTLDFAQLETKFHFTARLTYERYLTEKHQWGIWYGPFGATNFDQQPNDFNFAGVDFNVVPDNIFATNYRWHDIRGSYKYTFVNSDRWVGKAGGSLQWSTTEVDIQQRAADNITIIATANVSESAIAPLLHVSGALKFARKWRFEGEIDGMSYPDNYYWNAGLWLRYRPTELWDIGMGGRAIYGKFDTSTLYNKTEFTDFALQIGRSF